MSLASSLDPHTPPTSSFAFITLLNHHTVHFIPFHMLHCSLLHSVVPAVSPVTMEQWREEVEERLYKRLRFSKKGEWLVY